MTMRSFGRITPLQGVVLRLAGHGPSQEYGVRDIERKTGEAAAAAIRNGAAALRDLTGRDLGCSLSDWHERLSQDEAFSEEYRFPYAWRAVEAAALKEIAAPHREALEARAATPPAG